MKSFSRKLVAVCASASLALAGGSFGVITASAQEGEATSEATPANAIDTARSVTLRIHKYDGEPGDQSTPLPGVAYTVQKVMKRDGTAFDLNKAADWGELDGIVSAENANEVIASLAADGEAVVTDTTGEDGLTTFTQDAGAGVYRVTESTTPAGVSVGAPFLVALPYPKDGTWEYEQDVYPKNQRLQPDKQVDDSAATLGKNLKYTLNSPIPSGNLTSFGVKDELVEGLELQADTLTVTVDGAEIADADYTDSSTANAVDVAFTPAGLQKIRAAREVKPDAKVHVAFEAKVNAIPEGGTINNSATFDINGGSYSTNDGDQPTSTTFGTLTINKTSPESEEASDLSGAEFELYRCTGDAQEGFELDGPALQTSADATAAALQDKLTTTDEDASDRKAEAVGYGIPISSTSTGNTGAEANQYCVIETKAPVDFVQNPEIIPVTVDGLNLTADVVNHRSTFLSKLPATGAWGIAIVFLVGLALLARGLYTSRRDNQAKA